MSMEITISFNAVGTAHCANMYPASENDSQELKDARATILKTLTEWLSE